MLSTLLAGLLRALAKAGQYEAAVEKTKDALRLSPSDTYLGLYEFFHGIVLLVSRRFDESLPFLQRAVRSFPDLPNFYVGQRSRA